MKYYVTLKTGDDNITKTIISEKPIRGWEQFLFPVEASSPEDAIAKVGKKYPRIKYYPQVFASAGTSKKKTQK